MTQRNLKKTTIILAVTVTIVASMAVSASACECIDNLLPWNWGRNNQYAATTYAPPFSATSAPAMASYSTPSTYATARTACYVPQTSYRTVYRNVPVTSCQTVNSCDPCTGCPVTYYRPVTSYQKTAQLVPYTTYRMVWQNTPTCYTANYNTGCYSGGCYSGVCGTPTSSCNSCTSTTTTTSTLTPTARPTYADPQSAPGTRSTQRLIETKDVSPSPKPEADPNARNEYRSIPFQAPSLNPAGRTASYSVRHASYQTRTAPQPSVVREHVEWEAVQR